MVDIHLGLLFDGLLGEEAVGASGFLFDRYARGSILRGLLYLDSVSVLSSLGFFLLVFWGFLRLSGNINGSLSVKRLLLNSATFLCASTLSFRGILEQETAPLQTAVWGFTLNPYHKPLYFLNFVRFQYISPDRVASTQTIVRCTQNNPSNPIPTHPNRTFITKIHSRSIHSQIWIHHGLMFQKRPTSQGLPARRTPTMMSNSKQAQILRIPVHKTVSPTAKTQFAHAFSRVC